MDVVLENDDLIIEEEMLNELNKYLDSKKSDKDKKKDDVGINLESIFED